MKLKNEKIEFLEKNKKTEKEISLLEWTSFYQREVGHQGCPLDDAPIQFMVLRIHDEGISTFSVWIDFS